VLPSHQRLVCKMAGNMRDMFAKPAEAFAPIALVVSSVFLFGPYTVYSGKFEDSSVSFPAILVQLILPAMILLACLRMLLPPRTFP